MKKIFVAVSGSGQFIDASNSLDGAARAASRAGYENVELDQSVPDHGAEPMQPNAMDPREAHKLMGGLNIDYDAAMRMSLEEATTRALEWMPSRKVLKGKYQDLKTGKDDIVKRILGKNYKTSKKGGEYLGFEVYVDGLSLLPHFLWGDTLNRSGGEDDEYPKHLKVVKRPTLCAGASRECRESCLVYSGQNLNDVYSTISKLSWTNLMMYDPQAFMRILGERVHKNLRKRSQLMQFVRLNVLSDVPWEEVSPGFMDSMLEYRGREFSPLYDYTKVPGRNPGPFYDLTFSFSGTNAKICREEVDSFGRRVAVVFIDPENTPATDYETHSRFTDVQRRGLLASREVDRLKRQTGKTDARHVIPMMSEEMQEAYAEMKLLGTRRPVELPGELTLDGMTLPVVDGDIHDARALDPGNVFVGLKYKAPKEASMQTQGRVGKGKSKGGGLTASQLDRFKRGYGRSYERITSMPLGRQMSSQDMYAAEMENAFLVPAYETREGAIITAVVPRHEPDFTPGDDDVPEDYTTEGEAELKRAIGED